MRQRKMVGIKLKYLSIIAFVFCASTTQAMEVSLQFINSDAKEEKISDFVMVAKRVDVPTVNNPSQNKEKIYYMGQKEKKFVPEVLVVEVGSKVIFENDDTFAHSVYSVSGAKSFDLPLYKKGEGSAPSVLFDKPGRLTVGCNIHDQMMAHILVLDTPYFKMGTEGQAKLNLPDGVYDIFVWQPRMREKQLVLVQAQVKSTTNLVTEQELKSRPQGEKKKSRPTSSVLY